MNTQTISGLLEILSRLKSAHIYYTLSDHTKGAVMVDVSVPGERWELAFHEDGQIGIEKFVTTGRIQGVEALDELFSRFSD